jgi:hypothetical protein
MGAHLYAILGYQVILTRLEQTFAVIPRCGNERDPKLETKLRFIQRDVIHWLELSALTRCQ